MSNFLEDFIGPLEPYETLVEVANGGFPHVSHRGHTQVYIQDLCRTKHAAVVLLNNVLYVPGLTRRLDKLSAAHFLRCRSERHSLEDIEEGGGRPPSPNFYETGNDPVYQY
jgi:hypothetical protein